MMCAPRRSHLLTLPFFILQQPTALVAQDVCGLKKKKKKERKPLYIFEMFGLQLARFPRICMRLGWLRGDRHNLSDMLKVPTLSGKKFTCQKLHITPHHPTSSPQPPTNSVFTHWLNLYLSRKMFLSSSPLPSLSLILFSSLAVHKATLSMSNWGRNAPILYFTSSFTPNSPFLSKTFADVSLYLPLIAFSLPPCSLAAIILHFSPPKPCHHLALIHWLQCKHHPPLRL